jgi:prepilin signal peptidase PulO-like enzyme (type II secretory pathway)
MASTAIPFGPFLALGLWLTWLYGPLGGWLPSAAG